MNHPETGARTNTPAPSSSPSAQYSMADAWLAFSTSTIPAGTSPSYVETLRLAFYNGAIEASHRWLEAGARGTPLEKATAIAHGLLGELRAFASDIEQRHAAAGGAR